MRDEQNILEVAGLHPEMMGFIFYPESKRFVGDEFHIPEISSDIKKVGVFVNEEPEKVVQILKKHQLQTAQLHGSETPEICSLIGTNGFKVLKAFGIDENFEWSILEHYIPVTDGFVFDTKTIQHGGSGKKFNWNMLENYTLTHPFLLSGGIKAEDADKLLNFEHPQCLGFDVNSGFEIQPAYKDVTLLKSFITKIREK